MGKKVFFHRNKGPMDMVLSTVLVTSTLEEISTVLLNVATNSVA